MPFLRGAPRPKLPPSPTPALIGANIPPSPEEFQLIRELVDGLYSDFKGLVPSPLDPELSDSDLPPESRNIRQLICQHTRLLSCVHTLPDEILERIFFTFLSAHECIGEQRPRYAIAHVSKRWREVLHASPRLWGFLGWVEGWTWPLSEARRKEELEYTTVHLRRSQPHPITFVFATQPPVSAEHQESMTMFLSLLVQHSDRWHVASFMLPGQLLSTLGPIRNRLPMLSVGVGNACQADSR